MIDARASIANQGRLVVATKTRAAAEFPPIVLSIAHGDIQVTMGPGTVGSRVVLCVDAGLGIRMAMLELDFILLRKVAARFRPTLSPFHSEPRSALLGRAQALIRVEFASRGEF